MIYKMTQRGGSLSSYCLNFLTGNKETSLKGQGNENIIMGSFDYFSDWAVGGNGRV
nr:hypothetical protein [uncultured Enterobacter sp.]